MANDEEVNRAKEIEEKYIKESLFRPEVAKKNIGVEAALAHRQIERFDETKRKLGQQLLKTLTLIGVDAGVTMLTYAKLKEGGLTNAELLTVILVAVPGIASCLYLLGEQHALETLENDMNK